VLRRFNGDIAIHADRGLRKPYKSPGLWTWILVTFHRRQGKYSGRLSFSLGRSF
jgi:hypothetical protein